jgi:hypothetical protein
LHDSEATRVEIVPVKETFQGQTVWEGDVEVFDLADHLKASRPYAWSHETGDLRNPGAHTVLQIPPAITRQRVVQAAIAGMVRKAEANAES